MGYIFERNATFTNFSISKIDKEKPQAYANLYELLLLFKPIPNPAILKCKVIRLLFSYCLAIAYFFPLHSIMIIQSDGDSNWMTSVGVGWKSKQKKKKVVQK